MYLGKQIGVECTIDSDVVLRLAFFYDVVFHVDMRSLRYQSFKVLELGVSGLHNGVSDIHEDVFVVLLSLTNVLAPTVSLNLPDLHNSVLLVCLVSDPLPFDQDVAELHHLFANCDLVIMPPIRLDQGTGAKVIVILHALLEGPPCLHDVLIGRFLLGKTLGCRLGQMHEGILLILLKLL